MMGMGGTTALEKVPAKSNRTQRCCWQCRVAAEFDGFVASILDGMYFLVLSV